MASAEELAGNFQDEVTCSLCLEYFTDPVSIECGHNFCRACISRCWEGSDTDHVSCPQCREPFQLRHLRPNRQLGNLVELVKRLRGQAGPGPEGDRVCERHQEPLKLFCEEDQTPICMVCDRSRAHWAHSVVPIEEAAQEYRVQILNHVQHLKEKREELQGLKSAWDKESERLLRQAEAERQLMVSKCEELRQFVAEQEHLLLARLGELDKEVGKKKEENATRLCEEISRLSALITELEGKCQQPAPELLQDIRNAVSSSEKTSSPHPVPECPELEKKIWDFPGENNLQGAVTGFLERLAAERGLRRAQGFTGQRVERRPDAHLAARTSPPRVVEIQDEALCTICLEYLTEPVTLACAHNFCQGCITQCCEEWEKGTRPELTCPQCRAPFQKGEFRANVQLSNIVQKIKQLGLKPKADLCERHEERLKLFCEQDGEAICWVCEKSQDHKSHTVVPIEEAARDYKEKLQGALGPLKKELEQALARTSEEKKTTEWQRKVKQKREAIAGEFNRLHTLLREEEQILLQRLAEEEREMLQRLEENVTKLSQQSSSLQQLITEIEKKCQQRAAELLKGVKSTLSRSQSLKLQELGTISAELKNDYKICLDMKDMLKRFWVDVTLDPDTASPYLVLSEDRKRVRDGETRQDLPDNPERFDPCVCVLGAEGFTGGRRYWEVEVGDKTGWALGVCRESVSRKGEVTLLPGNGYWAVWLRDGAYQACTSPWSPLSMSVRPSQVGIFLDYEAGEVLFYNVTDRSLLFTFTDTFSGTLHPYFYPGVKAGGKNAAPLIICPVPAQSGGDL